MKTQENICEFDFKMDQEVCFPKIVSEDIVISGMSGRFPESDSTDEFAQNLYNGVDMIIEDDRRWPTGLQAHFNYQNIRKLFFHL